MRKTGIVAGLQGLCLTSLLLAVAPAQARQDQWYIGLGGGAATLRPDPTVPGLGVSEEISQSGTIFVGRDLDRFSSVQLQFYSLGAAELDDDTDLVYAGGDASIVYRLIDTRDVRARRSGRGVALYARFALGYMWREDDVSLENESPVYFGAGAGTELFLNDHISLRLEGLFHDIDVSSAHAALVYRFGGTGPRLRLAPPPVVPAPAAESPAPAPAPAEAPAANGQVTPAPASQAPRGSRPLNNEIIRGPGIAPNATTDVPDDETELPEGSVVVPVPDVAEASDRSSVSVPVPEPTGAAVERTPAALPPTPQGQEPIAPDPATAGDVDGDGVADAEDVCPLSVSGFPVQANGCALLDGVLSGVRFLPGTADLVPTAITQLGSLASLLNEWPDARVELHAHTDRLGTAREQAQLTRARLRTIGTYLVSQGIAANRLVLRSFAGSRPVADNATAEGRRLNNRIEVIEYTR